MERTDIHRPSVIDPTEYQWVAFEFLKLDDDIGAAWELQENRRMIREHMERTGGTYSHHAHGGNCMVCGNANAIYTVLFYHELTNTYVRMGQECAMKCDMAMSNGDMEAFRASCKHALELRAGKRKAQAVLEQQGLSGAWDLYQRGGRRQANGRYIEECLLVRDTWKDGTEESTVVDMVEKLITYGDLSDKQYGFIRVLLDRIPRREEIKAKREAEKAAAADCPTGRVKITGEVIKTELRDGAYGTEHRMTVKAAGGYIVWGSVPAHCNGIERGKRIEFTATFTPSDRDPKFGFFKRPMGRLIENEVQAA